MSSCIRFEGQRTRRKMCNIYIHLSMSSRTSWKLYICVHIPNMRSCRSFVDNVTTSVLLLKKFLELCAEERGNERLSPVKYKGRLVV